MNIKPNRAKAQATLAYVPPQVKRPRSYGWVFIIAVSLTTFVWWGWDRFGRTSAWGQIVADEVALAAPLGRGARVELPPGACPCNRFRLPILTSPAPHPPSAYPAQPCDVLSH